MRRARIIIPAWLVACFIGGAAAKESGQCFSGDYERRILACSGLIASPSVDAAVKSLAFSMRALAQALKGQYARALPDFDQALQLDPDSTAALNNRAWVYYKLKRTDAGLADVERSLDLLPTNPNAHDTRAHIFQETGRAAQALADYDRAMDLGGARIIKLYQCGLQEHGLYLGHIDGRVSRALRTALEACVREVTCDPLPDDEECRSLTS